MPSRFLQRMERQRQAIRDVWGEPQFDPPTYQDASTYGRPTQTPRSSMSDAPQSSPPPQYSQLHHTSHVSFERLVLPNNALVLVTGTCGWQGIHVADQLLQLGFRVRGCVQDPNDAAWINKFFEEKYGNERFMAAIVPDMVPRGAYDSAASGCSGVVHCASVTSMSTDPTQVITPSIAGALNALEAARKEPLMKRFVYCSSTAAASSSPEELRQNVTSDSWNMNAFLQAWAPPPYTGERCWNVYASSKLQTEQAVWRWYSDNMPHFTLNSVLPGTLFGRQLASKSQRVRSSLLLLKALWDGSLPETPGFIPNHFVDVQDSALIHAAALILPDVEGQRIFATNSSFDCNSILGLLRKLFPFRPFPADVEHVWEATVFRESGKGEELLRRLGRKGYTDLQTSVQRSCEGFCV